MPIIDNAIYVHGKRVIHPPDLSSTFESMKETGGMGWLGLYRPNAQEMHEVSEELGLHELAVEDTLTGHQRPKLDHYGDHLFVVLRPARYLDDVEKVEFGELHVYVGADFVVTVRHAESPNIGEVRKRMEDERELLAMGPEAVLYAVIDQVVDEYEPVAAGLSIDIDEIEEQLFSGEDNVSRRIYELSREVIEFQRAVAPLDSVIERLRKDIKLTDLGARRRPGTGQEIHRRAGPRHSFGRTRRILQGPAGQRALAFLNPRFPAGHGSRGNAERTNEKDLVLGSDPVRTEFDRQHLRDELCTHAGTAFHRGAIPPHWASWWR